LEFPISDQATVFVDVGTGNLRLQTASLQLPGVNSGVAISQAYNSFSSQNGSTGTLAAHRWTLGVQGVGSLAAGADGAVVYVAADGGVWTFTAGTGGTFAAPAGLRADLAALGSQYRLTFRDSRNVVTFDADGRPVSIADRNGNTTALTYGPSGLSTVVSTAGPTQARTATFAYNATTYTLTVSQASGYSSRSVVYTKDAASNLVKITDANGKQTTFGYSGGNLTTITAPDGGVTTITYESGSRKVLSVNRANSSAGSPGASITRLAYPSAGTTLVARPNTNQSTAVASVPHIQYRIDGNRLVSSATDEMGRSRAATYTANGDVASATSGTGNAASTTMATYGANNGDSLTSVQSPAGATQAFAYGNTAAETSYLPTTSTDSAGNATTYTYNGAGNPLTTSDAVAATAALTYNTNGTVATAAAPGNGSNTTKYTYNANAQLTRVTPVTGSSLGVRNFTYDDFGRVRTATDGKGVTVTYSYDKQDRLLSTAFSGGTATVTNTYDDNGRPKTRVDANGTTTYTYDQLGRLTARANTFAGGTITYGYDKSSNLVTVTDSRGTVTNHFDNSGTPTGIAYPTSSGTKMLNFATDDQGRRTDSWLAANAANTSWRGHTHQDYDASGRVSRAIAESMTNDGTVTTISDISYCYNTGTPAPTCAAQTSGDRAKLQWERNNITGQVTSYSYDGAGRLTGASQTGGTNPTTWTYTYDARGNRLTAGTTGGTTTSQALTFNAANQVTTTGYTFDGAGNMTADTAGTYAYNGAEQMTSATNASGTFGYKYAGTSQVEVLQQQTPTATYNLVYGRTNQVGQPVIEQAKIGSVTAYVDNDPVTGQPLMLRTSTGTVSLYVYDGTGNPTAILRDFAGAGYTYQYDPYGLPTVTSNSGGTGLPQNPFLFQGGIQDRATGWVHFGNRWYNPAIGRWTQQDTLDAPLDPTNANRYAYAGCDPINNTDPTGKCTILEALDAAVTVGSATGLVTAAGSAIVGAFVPVSLPVGALVTSIGSLVGANIGLVTYVLTC